MAAIIFDFDGTIADSFEYTAGFMVERAGQGPLNDEQRRQLKGLSMVDMAKKLGFHWWQGLSLISDGRQRMEPALQHMTSFDGLPKTIRQLHNQGHELLILTTNSVHNVQRFLRIHKLDDCFTAIYSGGILNKKWALRRLLRRQRLPVNTTAYVGDEKRDVEAAQAAGLYTVAVTWGFANQAELKALRPNALAETAPQLLNLLEQR